MAEIANAIRDLAEPLWGIVVILAWMLIWMLIFKDMGGRK